MAKVFLNSGESFTLANSAEVYGAAGTGTEKVLLTGAATGITTDQNIERVELSGNISAYTFQVVGNQVKVYAGTTLVTTIGVQGDADGTKVAFGDGSADLKITGLNQATLGGQALSSTAAAAVTGATLNATDKSATAGSGSTTPGVGQAFTLTSSTTADVPQLTTGNDTITGAAGTFGSSDVLADPSSTDNDTLNAVLTSSLTTAPTVSNVENINLDFKGFGITYNAASTSNAKIVASSTQDGNTIATLQNVGATTKVVAGTGISTLSLASSSATVNLTGGQNITVNQAAAVGTIGFVSSGSAANTVTYSAASTVRNIAVSGDQTLTLKTTNVADFASNTVSKTLTGSAKLVLDVGAAATADLGKVAADSFTVTATGATNLSFASGANVTVTKDLGASSSIGLSTLVSDSTTDSINLGVITQTTALVVDKFETVNLSNAGTEPLTLADLQIGSNASAAKTINLTSGQNVTFTNLTNNGTTYGVTLNAESLTSKLTVTAVTAAATAGNVIIKAGAGADSITLGSLSTYASTITGGAGNDTLSAATAGGAVTISGDDGNDTIIGSGNTFNDVLVGGAGNDNISTGTNASLADTIIGGAGDDVITLGASAGASAAAGAGTSNLSGSFSVNGGSGLDTLFMNLGGTNATVTSKIVDVENVYYAAGTANLTWTTADSDLASGSILFVSSTETNGSLNFDGSAETNGTFNINVKTTAASTVIGGLGNDTIVMASNASATITGGKGVDNITVGSTNSTVKFGAGDSGVSIATADIINATAALKLQFTSVTSTVETSAFASGTQLGTGWTVSTAGLATATNASMSDFISAAVAAGKAGSTGLNGQVVGFVSGTDTYVFYAGTDTTSNADDGLVKIVGFGAGDLSAGTLSNGIFQLG